MFRDNGKENGNYSNGLYWGNIGIREKKMEATIKGLGYFRDAMSTN